MIDRAVFDCLNELYKDVHLHYVSRFWGIAGMDLTCRVSFQCTNNNSCGILNMVTKCEKVLRFAKKKRKEKGFISLVIKKKKDQSNEFEWCSSGLYS